MPESSTLKKSDVPLAKNHKLSSFSIIERINKEEEKPENEKIKIEDNLPTNHFTNSDLEKEWGIFIEDLKKNDVVIYGAINGFKLSKKDENTVEVTYPTEIARVEFDKVQNGFFNHFKHKVNHFKIKIEYKLNSALKSEIITKKKIFDKLAEINPLLKNLDEIMKFDFS